LQTSGFETRLEDPDPQRTLLTSLGGAPELYRVIITSEARSGIPSHIWNHSWVIFLEDLRD
jgi:hypothetical protein